MNFLCVIYTSCTWLHFIIMKTVKGSKLTRYKKGRHIVQKVLEKCSYGTFAELNVMALIIIVGYVEELLTQVWKVLNNKIV